MLETSPRVPINSFLSSHLPHIFLFIIQCKPLNLLCNIEITMEFHPLHNWYWTDKCLVCYSLRKHWMLTEKLSNWISYNCWNKQCYEQQFVHTTFLDTKLERKYYLYISEVSEVALGYWLCDIDASHFSNGIVLSVSRETSCVTAKNNLWCSAITNNQK